MTAVLLTVALAAVLAAVVVATVKPWRRQTLTVTITVDTSRFDEAMRRAADGVDELSRVFARTAPTMAEAAERIQTAFTPGWLAAYRATKDWPRPPDDNPFPHFHLFRRNPQEPTL